jgi:hypothetical protein
LEIAFSKATYTENLNRVSEILQEELKDFFKKKDCELSDNGYIFFQSYDTWNGTVEYWGTQKFKFYKEAKLYIKTLLKEIHKPLNENFFDKPLTNDFSFYTKLIKDCLTKIVFTDNQYYNSLQPDKKEKQYIESIIDRTSKESIQLAERKNSKDESINLILTLQLALQQYLKVIKQPIEVGLANKRFEKASNDIVWDEDIFSAQASSIQDDDAIYASIRNVERFFFVGGIDEGINNLPSSFVIFLDIFYCGQRAGYLFIIESYRTVEERNKKLDITKEYLEGVRAKAEKIFEKIKTDNFLNSIFDYAIDIISDDPSSLSEIKFGEIISKSIRSIVNVEKNKPIEIVEFSDKCYLNDSKNILELPVILEYRPLKFRLSREFQYERREPCKLSIPLCSGDINRKSPHGLNTKENLNLLLIAYSAGLRMFGTIYFMQQLARDAEWRSTFKIAYHNTAGYLIGFEALSKSLYANTYSMSDIAQFIDFYREGIFNMLELSRYLNEPEQLKMDVEQFNIVSVIEDLRELFTMILSKAPKHCLKLGENNDTIIIKAKQNKLIKLINENNILNVQTYKFILISILYELIKNSIENSEGQDPQIEIKTYIENSNKKTCLVNIENDGIMSEENRKLFITSDKRVSKVQERNLGSLIITRWSLHMGIELNCYVDEKNRKTKFILKIPYVVGEKYG